MLQKIFFLTAADTKSLRNAVQQLPFQILISLRYLISEGPDDHILIIRYLFRLQREMLRKNLLPVFHLCFPVLRDIRYLIIIRLHRLITVQIQESRSQKHRFLIVSGLKHTHDKNSRRNKSQEMFASFHHFIHQQMGKQHRDQTEGKMHFYDQLVTQPGLFLPAVCPEIQEALHQQNGKQQQITVKKGSGSQSALHTGHTMSVEFQTLPVQRSEEIPETGTDAVGEKRRDPVRVEKWGKIFRAQIVLDQHIHHSRTGHHQSRNDPSALTASADPEKAGQQQKQKHVRPHQGQ